MWCSQKEGLQITLLTLPQALPRGWVQYSLCTGPTQREIIRMRVRHRGRGRVLNAERPRMVRVPDVTEWKTVHKLQSEGICVYPCESLTCLTQTWTKCGRCEHGSVHIPLGAFHVGLLCYFYTTESSGGSGLSQECGPLPSPAAAFIPFISFLLVEPQGHLNFPNFHKSGCKYLNDQSHHISCQDGLYVI